MSKPAKRRRNKLKKDDRIVLRQKFLRLDKFITTCETRLAGLKSVFLSSPRDDISAYVERCRTALINYVKPLPPLSLLENDGSATEKVKNDPYDIEHVMSVVLFLQAKTLHDYGILKSDRLASNGGGDRHATKRLLVDQWKLDTETENALMEAFKTYERMSQLQLHSANELRTKLQEELKIVPKRPPGKGGRKPDLKKAIRDQKLLRDWETDTYKTHEELGVPYNMSADAVRKALIRARRARKSAKKPDHP